jgi:hypothetical protein
MAKIPKSLHGKTHIGTVYLGGIFGDGGGIEISPLKNGGVAIIIIPPRAPVLEQLAAVATLVERAESVQSPELKAQLMAFATQLASEVVGAPESAVPEDDTATIV